MTTDPSEFKPCPVCGLAAKRPPPTEQGQRIKCGCCGSYMLTDMAEAMLVNTPFSSGPVRARIAYSIRRQQGAGLPLVDQNFLNCVEKIDLPDAAEMLDNLLLHLAKQSPGVGTYVHPERMRATVGAVDAFAVFWAMDEL